MPLHLRLSGRVLLAQSSSCRSQVPTVFCPSRIDITDLVAKIFGEPNPSFGIRSDEACIRAIGPAGDPELGELLSFRIEARDVIPVHICIPDVSVYLIECDSVDSRVGRWRFVELHCSRLYIHLSETMPMEIPKPEIILWINSDPSNADSAFRPIVLNLPRGGIQPHECTNLDFANPHHAFVIYGNVIGFSFRRIFGPAWYLFPILPRTFWNGLRRGIFVRLERLRFRVKSPDFTRGTSREPDIPYMIHG